MTSRFPYFRFLLALLLLGAGFAPRVGAVEKLDGRLRLLQQQSNSGGGYRTADVDDTGPIILVPIFIEINSWATRDILVARYPEIRFSGQHGNILTGRCPISSLAALAADPDVLRAQAGTQQRPLLNVVKSTIITSGNFLGIVDEGSPNFGTRDGSNVIFGIVDSGVDYTHEDFITGAGFTRILFLWDQTDEIGAPGTFHPDGFTVGTEWTEAQINDEIDGSPAGNVRQTDTVGHGTHVLGIAAGDGSATDGDVAANTFVGIAPDADIIVVKTTLFNTDILDGVRYIVDKAASLGKRAVINLSLGSHSGPHDGTSSYETGIALVASTVPVVIAMGNEAASAIHAAATVAPAGEETFQFTLAGSPSSVETEFWVPSGDLYTVTVTTAAGGSGAVSATPGQDISSTIGALNVAIFNSPTSHPAGDRQILIRLTQSPSINATNFFVRMQRSASGGSGRVDAWIVNFANVSWVNFIESSRTISVPATANNVIAVGSYCSKRTWTADDNLVYNDTSCTAGLLGDISNSSSLGPTRDGRLKPDVAAPGQRVASAQSVSNTGEPIANIQKDGKHRLISGTSMASPVIAGAALLALESDPDLTVEEFRTLITSHARVDAKVAAHGATPNTLWGYGKARIFGCGDVIVSSAASVVSDVLGTSSISWNWSRVAGAQDYNLYFADTLALITNVSATTYLQTSLQGNSTVQFLVRGNNACGEGPDGVSASTSTLSILTAAPVFSVFESSITGVFGVLPTSPRSASSFGYQLDASTTADFSATIITSATPNNQNGSLTVTGLLAFTSYYMRLGTLNEVGGVNFALLGIQFTETPLNPPGIAVFTNVTETQIEANWVLNGNPAGLEYIAQTSTASDFSGTLLSSQTFALKALFTGLTENTQYHFRVRATEGPFASLNFEETLSAAPKISTPAFTSVSRTSVTVAWNDLINPAGTQYRAQISPAADFAVSVISSDTLNLTATFTGLLGNTTYYLRTASLGIGGGLSAFDTITASPTLTNAPTSAAPPITGVFASSITVAWNALPTTPPDQSAEGYRVDASTASDFTGTLTSQFIFSPTANSLTVSGLLQDTTYNFRVGALNWQNIPSYLALGSTKTVGQILSSGTAVSGQAITLNVNPSVPEIVTIQVKVPANTFPAGTEVGVNATIGTLLAPQSSQGSVTLLSDQIGVDITASNGNQPVNPVEVLFTYSPAQIPPNINLDTIIIGRLDGDSPLWTLLPTVHDPVTRQFKTVTTHFSIFSPLIVTASTDLDDIQIFPVPWKTGTGDPFFDASFLSFTNLPAGGRITLYTMLGEFVWEKTAPASGILLWNGKNRLGHDVGSGTYLAVLQFNGKTIVKRVVVVR